ncbi:unnamed protein product [Diamesa serratosioi]
MENNDNDPYAELEMYLEKIKRNNNEILLRNDADDGNLYGTVKGGIGGAKMYDDVTKDVTTAMNRTTVENFSDSMMEMRDDWNFMTQFDNIVEFEMKNLTNLCNRTSANNVGPSTAAAAVAAAVVAPRTTATKNDNNNNHLLLKPEKHITIPLQSFSTKTQILTNVVRKPPVKGKSASNKKYYENMESNDISKMSPTMRNFKEMSPNTWSSDDSILKSSYTIDEDNKSTTSTVSSSSAFDDSTNLYSEKSGSSVNSINILNKIKNKQLQQKLNVNAIKTEYFEVVKTDNKSTPLDTVENDDVSDALSLYDNESGNDEFDEKCDVNCNNCYSPNKHDIKFNYTTENETSTLPRNLPNSLTKIYYNQNVPNTNSLPMMKRHVKQDTTNIYSSFNSMSSVRQKDFQQEPFHTIPSPTQSYESCYIGRNVQLPAHLGAKSSSAPMLMKNDFKKEDINKLNILRNSRSQSDRYLIEIQAIEAANWLREAGFPQYAQMYEDQQFPIDLNSVEKDHPFLEKDPLQSLFRRLAALNRYATMRLDGQYQRNISQRDEDSDVDEDDCALSENWTFQPELRRWSRLTEIIPLSLNLPSSFNKMEKSRSSNPRESSPEDLEITVPSIDFNTSPNTLPLVSTTHVTPQHEQVKFRRSGSERLKDGAKALLRRVESIKSRRKKRQNREGVVISGPQILDLTHIHQKFEEFKCFDITTSVSNPTSPTTPSTNNNNININKSPIFFMPDKSHSSRTSPLHFFSPLKTPKSGDDSSSYCSEGSQDSSGGNTVQTKKVSTNRFFMRSHKNKDTALSDSECQPLRNRKKISRNYTCAHFPDSIVTRGGSLNLGKESNRYREHLKTKKVIRSRSAVRETEKSTESDNKDDEVVLRTNRVRWHSFHVSKRVSSSINKGGLTEGVSLLSMSCGQLQVIRKLALVTLTGYMERHCPTHRSGWNWELPKFIKKIKAPDYKDKKVFGVPFLLSLQRTGHTLPKGIQAALTWLKINALDQIGIFRKSGVKSRIAKLKASIEQTEENIIGIFEDQQAYDVADVVKQYFRDLPESLLTTKLSETFVAIFLYLPSEVRHDAIQSAILLLPDEHREVLLMLLEFLYQVTAKSKLNQMNAGNLAVCLSPSIFHNGLHASKGPASASPRRKKPTGLPEQKDLNETRASQECLTYLILNFKKVYHITSDKISRCKFGYMEESKPVTLESLGDGLQVQNWCGYLYECIKATVKEGREKSRGWISINSLDNNVDISYRKVGDGHPLRLWRCIIEVNATPADVLHLITKERHLWDRQLLKMRVVKELDDGKSDIFQYAQSNGHIITDYCVLRTSCTDLPRGACASVETSIEHSDAVLLMGGVRGVVLASRYFIEPCGTGRSRILHLARVDTKGRNPEWYNKNYGHICSQYLSKIRIYFKQHQTEET